MAGMDANAKSDIELRLSGRHLPNLDFTSKSDAFAVVYLQTGTRPPVEIGRTETVRDNLDPDWSQQITLTYFFEVQQVVTVRVYDEDKKGSRNLADHDFLGESTFSVGSLVASPGQQKTLPLANPRRPGSRAALVVKAEELASCADWLTVQFVGKKLANKDGLFGKSDPFIVIKKIREDGSFVQVWKSVVVKDTLNPVWPQVQVSVQNLCNGDYDRPLRVEVYDWDKDGSTDYMGGCNTSIRALLEGKPLEMIEEKKKAKSSSYKNSGTVTPTNPSIVRIPSLLDYIKGGCPINLIVGIDFTGSNGSPDHPQSLHYFDPTGRVMNQYQQAIVAIGNILKDYTSDNTFHVFGFGARLPDGTTSHCFPVTFADPRVSGVEGIMGAYSNCLRQVRLSGPTLFAPILNTAIAYSSAPETQQQQYYNIVLMITDGEINDMEQTIAAVVKASTLPLSIIIVGVGGADFTAMNFLDADGKVLVDNTSGRRAVRDCVQFVPYNQFSGRHFSELAQVTLAEIPAQLLQYFRSQNILPNPPLQAAPSASTTSIGSAQPPAQSPSTTMSSSGGGVTPGLYPAPPTPSTSQVPAGSAYTAVASMSTSVPNPYGGR